MTRPTQAEMFEWSRAVAVQSMSRSAQPGIHHPWPHLPLVDLRIERELSSIWWIAGAVDWHTFRYWSAADQVPHLIKTALRDAGYGNSIPYWRFAQPRERGQILFVPDPNIRIVFDPAFRSDAVIVAELGCAHTFNAVRRSNCYQEDRCDKCGYHWAVDSSD